MDKLPPHPLTAEAKLYIASLDARGKELHELAVEKLGSSYFVDRTLGFQKWKRECEQSKKK